MPTVRPRGNGFQSIVRVKKGGVLIHQESRMFSSYALAHDWGTRVEAAVRRDGAPARKTASMTMESLIDKYRAARAEVKPLRRAMEHELNQLISHVGAWRLDTLSPERFTKFARDRRAAGAGPATVMHNLATLRAILGAAKPMFGVEVDALAVAGAINALTRSGHVARSECLDRRTSDDEIARLVKEFERIAGNPSTIIPMATIVPLAVALPRRLGELCSMRWEDLDRLNWVLILRDTKHPTKPRTERIPVPPKAQKIIEALPVVDERILPYKSESVSASFERACARLGIEDLRFHDLRHEGICRLFEMGLAIQEVAMVSGHTNWSMLRRYTHLKPENVLEKMQ